MKAKWLTFAVLTLPLQIAQVNAAAFTSCPSSAFLMQKSTAELYSVNLTTGSYTLLSDDLGTTGKINGIGYNHFDDYLYGWSYENNTLVKIGSDYQIQPLAVTSMPTTYFVGDVATTENKYVFYRKGSKHGLYEIPLDPDHENYLQVTRIIDGGSLNLGIYDLAFHPNNGFMYTVNAGGKLFKIDSRDGSQVNLGYVGQSGTFGAVYFDASGHLYISRNKDGHIFKIDVSAESPTAELFAYGPSSNTNDGARCATAEVDVPDDLAVDFGDAPDTYGTSLNNNGARHEMLDGSIYLGALVDQETAALVSPLSDDSTDGSNDDDGIAFITGLEVGAGAALSVQAASAGYLNAWFDFDRDGVFEEDEQVFTDESLVSGQTILSYDVPEWASAGDTWTRFRFSSVSGIGPTGGVSDGEVEDYPITVNADRVSSSYYPSAEGWVTLAYEDNWPIAGDYDLNDLVVNYRTTTFKVLNSDSVTGIRVEGKIVAMGANNHNGFAVHLPGITRNQIDETSIQYTVNGTLQAESPLELGRPEAILMISDDIKRYVSIPNGCKFYRTEQDCDAAIEFEFDISLSFTNSIAEANMPDSNLFDPFMFATTGHWRNHAFGNYPGRSYEIHLKDYAGTSAFNPSYYGLADDHSDVNVDRFFQNQNAMPWAIEVATEWKYPIEYIDIQDAYPDFDDYVLSGGTTHKDWYLDERANIDNVFNP